MVASVLLLLVLKDIFPEAFLDSWTTWLEEREGEEFICRFLYPTSQSLPNKSNSLVLLNCACLPQITAVGATAQKSHDGTLGLQRPANPHPLAVACELWAALVSMSDKHCLLFLMPQQHQESPGAPVGDKWKASEYMPLGSSVCDGEELRATTEAEPMAFRACGSSDLTSHLLERTLGDILEPESQ